MSYCHAELKLNWLTSGTTIARQRIKALNLIQSCRVQKTKTTIHPAVYPYSKWQGKTSAKIARSLFCFRQFKSQKTLQVDATVHIVYCYCKKKITGPEQITVLFCVKATKYDSRRSKQFVLDRPKKETGRLSLRSRGAMIWNSVPGSVKDYDNVTFFKNRLKQHFKFMNNFTLAKESSH